MTETKCPFHPEVKESITELEKEMKKKVSFATLAWGIGISIVILCAILGAIWTTTIALEHRLAVAEEKLILRIEKVDQQNDAVIKDIQTKIDNLAILTNTLAVELRIHTQNGRISKSKSDK